MMTSISELRKKAKMTQAQLADAVGVKQSSVAQWENGKTVPRTSLLPAIASALGVPIDQLLTEKSA